MTLPGALLLVTDRRLSVAPLAETVRACLAAGLTWVWLRDRDLQLTERSCLARELRTASEGTAALVIGADCDLALATGADGVHCAAGGDVAAARTKLGPRALVGASAHSLDEIKAARDLGADYATLSPIFASDSKPGYGPPLGLSAVERAARLGVPIVALGGVTPAAAADCLRAGAQAVAVLSGILSAANPGAATRDYLLALHAKATAGR